MVSQWTGVNRTNDSLGLGISMLIMSKAPLEMMLDERMGVNLYFPQDSGPKATILKLPELIQ
jgi:hypothetical protein